MGVNFSLKVKNNYTFTLFSSCYLKSHSEIQWQIGPHPTESSLENV